MHKINYTDDIDLSKISRRGSFDKSKLPSESVRSYCVSVRLNVEELQQNLMTDIYIYMMIGDTDSQVIMWLYYSQLVNTFVIYHQFHSSS